VTSCFSRWYIIIWQSDNIYPVLFKMGLKHLVYWCVHNVVFSCLCPLGIWSWRDVFIIFFSTCLFISTGWFVCSSHQLKGKGNTSSLTFSPFRSHYHAEFSVVSCSCRLTKQIHEMRTSGVTPLLSFDTIKMSPFLLSRCSHVLWMLYVCLSHQSLFICCFVIGNKQLVLVVCTYFAIVIVIL